MQKERATDIKPLRQEDLRALATATGPCLTIVMATPQKENEAKELRLRLRGALREAEEKLQAHKVEASVIEQMLEPLRSLGEDPDDLLGQGKGILILRTPESQQLFSLPQEVQDQTAAGDRFLITPVMNQVQEEREFYILGLSKRQVRLLRCTDHSSEEVPLPIPANLDEFMQLDKPDHNQKSRHAALVAGGNNGGVMFGTGPDDMHPIGVMHTYFKAIDHAITHEVLRDSKAPLVLAAVEYELAEYRKLNSYQHLVEESVHGSPDGLKGGEMHKRALELLGPHMQQHIEQALAQFEKSGPERSSDQVREVVKAAYDGRVLHLFVREGASHMGNFDEMTRKVHDHAKHPQTNDECLLNAAAVQTLTHAGKVFMLPKEKMPNHAEIAAVFRY